MREDGLKRINDLYTAWHGKEQGRISVFPAAALAENSSPELLRAVRDFAEKHDLGYTIHLSQSRAEVAYMKRHHGMSPVAFLAKHDFLGPRLFAAHCRYVDDADIALLAKSGTIVSHQAAMAGNRGVIPPIPALRAAGVPIAMGTDNNTTDLFEVLRVALVTERVRARRRVPRRAAAAGRRARGRHARQRAGRAADARPSARSRSARRPTSSSSTRSASTSCRPCASSRRGSTTASRPTSSR